MNKQELLEHLAPMLAGMAPKNPKPNVGGYWNESATEQKLGYRRATEVVMSVVEVENGRIFSIGEKQYLVPQGKPLLEIIGQALVEAQLEK